MSPIVSSLDPRSKLALWACLMLASVCFPPGWHLAAYVCLVVSTVVLLTGCVRAVVSFIFRLFLPTAAMLLLVYGFLIPAPDKTACPLLDGVGVSLGGVLASLTIAARLATIAIATIGFSAAVPPTQLASGLRAIGFPSPVVGVFVSSFNIYSLMLQKLHQIADAQRSRGLQPRGLIWGRLRVYVPMLQPLLFGLLQGAVERASLWHSRGYLEHVGYHKLVLRRRDGAVLILAVVVLGWAMGSRWIS